MYYCYLCQANLINVDAHYCCPSYENQIYCVHLFSHVMMFVSIDFCCWKNKFIMQNYRELWNSLCTKKCRLIILSDLTLNMTIIASCSIFFIIFFLFTGCSKLCSLLSGCFWFWVEYNWPIKGSIMQYAYTFIINQIYQKFIWSTYNILPFHR